MQVSEEVQETRSHAKARLIQALPGALVTVAITAIFFSLYWNRFAGLRSGNGSFQGGTVILRGFFPYRDFFTAGPPLNEIFSAAVLYLFGQKLVVIRAWGVFERMGMALLLYFWLVKFFRPRNAALGSILAIIVSAGDPSNSLSSYGFEAIFFFLLSGWAMMRSAELRASAKAFALWAAAAGLFAATSFGTKQTLGVGATVGLPLLALLYIGHIAGRRKVIVFLAAFAVGWCVGAGAVLLWLASIGAIPEFLQDVFRKGPSAKASHPSDFVIRAAHAAWAIHWGFFAGCAAIAACWSLIRRAFAGRSKAEDKAGIGWIAVFACLSIAIGAMLSYAGRWPLRDFDNFAIYFGLIGTFLLAVLCLWELIRGKLYERALQIGFLAAVAFGIALMVSLSWPASFDMVFPGFGLMTAAVLDGADRRQRAALYAVCALVICAMTGEKLNRPHGFHEWMEPPVRFATAHSTQPELAGLAMPPATVRFLDGTAQIVKQHSTAADTIFVYPEFGLLYPLFHRKFPTVTDSHNIDVVNDEFARSEAARLLNARPAVIIYYPTPEWSLRADEKLWRNGARSGQRDLIAAIEKLAASYRLAASFHVPPNQGSVRVYVRQ